MSGYPRGQPGYGYAYSYGAPNPYASAPPAPNAHASPSAPYAAPPAGNPYGPIPTAHPHGATAPPYYEQPPKDKPQASYSTPYNDKPQKDKPYSSAPPFGSGPGMYGNPFSSLLPSSFPPGTDPNLIACFNHADQDRSGFIDDKELQMALSGYNQTFSLRTVHLLMYLFTNTNSRVIGPKEFTQVFYSLQNWRTNFERFDRDMSGRIDSNELRDALMNLGFAVSPAVINLLIVKFGNSGGQNRGIEYDHFIECCLIVKGLTEKFKEKDTSFSGSATFSYEAFMLTVLPFLIA